jgi:hypothetical protein
MNSDSDRTFWKGEWLSLFTSMSSVTLVHPAETLKVPVLEAINKCSLFQKNQTLSAAPYRIKSPVTLPHFREFVSALEGKEVEITDANFTGLQRLSEEFGFSECAAKLSEFRPSTGFQEAADADSRGRIAALEERHDRDIAVLRDKLRQLSTDFGRLAGEVSALRSAAAPPAPIPSPQPIPPFGRKSANCEEKFRLCGAFRWLHSSIRGSFRAFRRSSQSSGGSGFRFCGGAAAIVLRQRNFTDGATATQTL